MTKKYYSRHNSTKFDKRKKYNDNGDDNMKTDIYTLAHEVKNPLCVVKGYLEMLNENNLERYKKIIQDELDNSIYILDNYLEYKKLSVDLEIMDINLLLFEIKKSFKEYLENLGINLQINVIDDDIYVMGDYLKLKQVFNNLIKNSVEAQSKNIVINYRLDDNKLIIELANDGFKILSDKLSELGNNYTDKVMGNGIGVNLSKKIIELHDGEIVYKNNVNTGITVSITLLLG